MVNIIGVISCIVSAITQCTKETAYLKNIPTNLEVILLSFLCNGIYWQLYACHNGTAIQWYTVAEISIVTALVTMFGWEKFDDIYKRLKR